MALRLEDPILSDLADEELVGCFQAGDVAALNVLLDRYRGFARAKARGYFLIGADSDDIEQEGLIGLYKAARDFRADREASFRATMSRKRSWFSLSDPAAPISSRSA